MSNTPRPDVNARPVLAPGYRMQWEPAQNCHVILYPEGMVQLNDTATVILQKCNGQNSITDIVHALQEEYGEADLWDDVLALVREAGERGWIRLG